MLRQHRVVDEMYEKIFDGIREQSHVGNELRLGLVCDACDIGDQPTGSSLSRKREKKYSMIWPCRMS